MNFQATVNVFFAENKRPIPNVKVSLFDKDSFSDDDLLGTRPTNRSGQATFSFSRADFADRFGMLDDDIRPGRGAMTPELYAVVHGIDGAIIPATQSQIDAAPPYVIHIPIAQNLVSQIIPFKHKPRLTHDQLLQMWDAKLRKFVADDPGNSPADLCLMRFVLDTMSGLNDPKTDTQKQVVEQLKNRVTQAQFNDVAQVSANGLAFFDQSQFTNGISCSATDDVENLAKHLIKTSDTLSQVAKALEISEPPLDANLGIAKAGLPFLRTFDGWPKDCEANYLTDPNNFANRSIWDEFYPDKLEILEPPQLNEIKVRDPREERIVREARVPAKELDILALLDDIDIENSVTLEMSVPLDDANCVVLKSDAFDNGRQILAVDVKPGQQIGLYGSGFVAPQATWSVERALWEEIDAEGRLVPEQFFVDVANWDGEVIQVFGMDSHPNNSTPQTFTGDRIVFNWPDNITQEGLYRMQLIFRNEEGLVTGVEADPSTCDITITRDEKLRTMPFYFAILPKLEPFNIRVKATDVNCIDETNPELPWPFADDIRFGASALVQRYELDNNGNISLFTSFEGAGSGGQHWFKDGETWQPNFSLMPENTSSLPLPLNFNEFLIAPLIAEESDDIDATVIIWIVAIVFMIVVSIIVVVVAVIIGLLFEGVGVFPALGVAAKIVAAIWTEGIPITQMIVEYVVAELDDVPIATLAPMFAGDEIAHQLSPVRFHRFLWSIPRSVLAQSIRTTDFDRATNRVTEVYRVAALGGTYDFQLEIDA